MTTEGKSSEGLGGAKESSSKEELFSGSLESPEDEQTSGSESPKAEAVASKGESTGTSSSETEDSELAGIFTDLEKDIPEELKSHAVNVKKKMQGYFTKKNQTLSKELETLRANQVTDDLKRDYSTLYGWYDKIQKNPQQGLKELASNLGISVKALVEASEAESPKEEALTLQQVAANPTAENWLALTRQEVRNALQELRDKEVKPLQEKLSKFEGTSIQRENIQYGAQAFEEASKIPGFLDENKKSEDPLERLSEDGKKALIATLEGKFGRHPDALKNAFKAISSESLVMRVKSLDEQLVTLKSNITGASTPPESKNQKTTIAPSSPKTFWKDLRAESLT